MNERFTQAPHHNDRNSTQSPNAALLIDFDNVTMGIRSNLGQELRQLMSSDIIRGKVSVQRAYADWRRYPQYVVPLSEAAIDLIYAPAYGSSKKNATDIRLAIDALELVFTRPEIGTFILLSGDSDFSSLVLKLKEYGKYVIGVGMQESSSDLLVQNCDEYYSYDSLSGLVSADEMDTDRHDPWELAEHSIKKMVERDDVMRSDRLKQVMLELDPSFDEKEIGYSKFNRFLTEASSRGILQLQKIGNGQYKVGPGSSVDVEAPSGDGGSGGSGSSASSGGESPPPPRDLSEETDGGGTATKEAPEQTDSSGGASGGGQESGGRQEGGGRRQQDRQEGGGARSAARKRAGGDRPVVEAEQLREAYDLLRDVVSDLSDEDGRVRDSEVKREMLNRDSSFDEGALGFSKFSRFIRQAHDEEVVDIEKDSDGNYYLSVGGDGASAGAPQQQG
ncbi:MAG: NYN domain-containing protein, partial [Gemmatimonadota bacterium]